MPLILTSNDVTIGDRYQWKDITGVQYHYPNIYRNLIRTGEAFIYYRGVRRAQGPRQAAEYFGCGSIGDVWADPETADDPPTRKAWYCEIEDYVPFEPTVGAKIDGAFWEQIPSNMWRSGVRRVPSEIYSRIVKASATTPSLVPPPNDPPAVLPIEMVQIPEGSQTVLFLKQRKAKTNNSLPSIRGRRSRHAKLVGDRAEEIALKWIAKNVPGASALRWVAQAGETPGWDIEFLDAEQRLTAVEVKGASGLAINDFEVTQNELEAIRKLGARYMVILVANCLGSSPVIEVINDLAQQLDDNVLVATPSSWRVSLQAPGTN